MLREVGMKMPRGVSLLLPKWNILVLCSVVVSLPNCCHVVHGSILNTLLGVPAECVHQNGIWPCKLSFSCWLQGGSHAAGCGLNKWLFSCCLHDKTKAQKSPATHLIDYVKRRKTLPKRIITKRRDDDYEDDDKTNNDNDISWQGNYECGVQRFVDSAFQKRIIGGRPARFAEYPWQAHIRISEYQCGGVLVSQQIVATAAHCIMHARLEDIAVYLGELDTQSVSFLSEPLPAEKRSVSQKIIHPRFRFRMTQPDRYDLMLLKLTKPVEFNEHIIPICLPKRPIRLIGRIGLIAGWGKTEATLGHSGTNMLQIATVPIISSAECIQWHKLKRIHVELFGEMFCAGHPDGRQDACLGDSGGPLIIKDRGRYILVGITSAGFGCGIDYQPGIYHNIQKTSQWIHEVIRNNSS